jgi:predicted nucleotidyltransferase
MIDTLPSLQKQLPKNYIETIRTVVSAAERLEIPSFIVGATARDIIFVHVYNVPIYRETTDIDFGIAVESWAKYELLKKTLIDFENFRPDKKQEQRLWRGKEADEIKIDLVPYGKLEQPAGQIAFPPDGDFVMTTDGFTEAYKSSLIAELTDDLKVRVVSPAGLALLKFVSYDDKPHTRIRDLQDIWFMMKNYEAVGNKERIYEEDSDLLDDENFDVRTVGARLLGRDMARLLTTQTKKIIFKHLAENESDIGLSRIAETTARAEEIFDDHLPQVVEMFRQLRLGISERSE